MRALRGEVKPPHARAHHDFYPTPTWATRALLAKERFEGPVWECACGAGHMALALEAAGHKVIATDLVDRGHGESRVDFTMATKLLAPNIVTNPPYVLGQEFVEAALRLRPTRVAFLLKLTFLESQGREKLFRRHAPARVWVFARRPAFKPGEVDEEGSGVDAHAWFVWDRDPPLCGPRLGWLPA